MYISKARNMNGYKKRFSQVDNLLLLQEIHKLIKIESTGTLEDLCRRFNMSRTGIARRLEQLREKGANIDFIRDHYTKSFVYTNNFEFEVHITIKSS